MHLPSRGPQGGVKVLHLAAPTKTPFPNKVTCTGSRDLDIDVPAGGPLLTPPPQSTCFWRRPALPGPVPEPSGWGGRAPPSQGKRTLGSQEGPWTVQEDSRRQWTMVKRTSGMHRDYFQLIFSLECAEPLLATNVCVPGGGGGGLCVGRRHFQGLLRQKALWTVTRMCGGDSDARGNHPAHT